MKAVNIYGAARMGMNPFGFRPLTEAFALAIELFVLLTVMRWTREDILLGNLGIRLDRVLVPLAALHVALSLALHVALA